MLDNVLNAFAPHIFIAGRTLKLPTNIRTRYIRVNCIYEEHENYSPVGRFSSYTHSHRPPGAAKKSREYELGPGGLWFSNWTIQSKKKEAKEAAQSQGSKKETKPACISEKKSVGKLESR